MSARRIEAGGVRGGFQELLESGRVRCVLCPRECELQDGQRGFCYIRERRGDAIWLTSYGRASGFCIDPIEKKPLYHFYPGTSVLSFGTVGCNLSCRYCQNWDITRSRNAEHLGALVTPEQIADAARVWGCRSVAFTYNDPVVFAEFVMDAARACRTRDVRTVAVTAGYLAERAREPFFECIDAANVDLKASSAEFYRRICGGELAHVKETLRYLVQKTSVWLELTTLLIPKYNDSVEQVAELSRWVRDELGPSVPLHFSAFRPEYRMLDVPATPKQTCERARDVARHAGLEHVYTGNVDDEAGQSSYCAQCAAILVSRRGYVARSGELEVDHCRRCNRTLVGRFDPTGLGSFGARRVAIAVASRADPRRA